MTITWLKPGKAAAERDADDAEMRATVESVLADITARWDAAVRDLSRRYDRCDPPSFRLSASEL